MFSHYKPKIYVRLTGGLGNQLFCYACAKALSLKLNWPLVLDISAFEFDKAYGRVYLLNQFNISADETSFKPIKPGRAIWPFREKIVRYREPSLDNSSEGFTSAQFKAGEAPNPVSEKVLEGAFDGSMILTGYWQSEDYFIASQETIRNDLKITLDIPEQVKKEATKIDPERSVCIGVRRYSEAGPNHSHHTLSPQFYLDAMHKVSENIQNPIYHIVCADEDRTWVKENLPGHKDFIWVPHYPNNEDAFKNLWLMSQFSHFILANSTYHWWGAWLSSRSSKTIISPQLGWTSQSPHIRGSIIL